MTDKENNEPNKTHKSLEEQYPGITEQISRFKQAEMPSCPHCRSENTASVQVGVIGRTMAIAASTSKVKLVLNRTDEMGNYYCNACRRYFS